MKKIRLETAYLGGSGMVFITMGLFGIIISSIKHEPNLVVSCLVYLVLGIAYSISGMEKMSDFKLNKIHDWLGPYEPKKPDRFLVISYILKFLGASGNLGGTVLIILIFIGYLPLENNNLALGILAMGFAFTTLGKLYSDDGKYNDIAEKIKILLKERDEVSEEIHQIYAKLSKQERKKKRLGLKTTKRKALHKPSNT